MRSTLTLGNPLEIQQSQYYRYQPRDALVRQQDQPADTAPKPLQREQLVTPKERSSRQQDIQPSNPSLRIQQGGPPVRHAQPPQRGASAESRRGQGPENERKRGEEKGQDRNR